MIVERYGCFGGCISHVGMETLSWYRYEGTDNDATGIGIEIERMAEKMGATRKFPFNDSNCLDADLFKHVADVMVSENNIRPLLHATVVEVVMEGNNIDAVIVETKSGRLAIKTKVVIDCTGDGDVAFLAGVDCIKYDKKDMMGVTSVFSVAGVNKEKFLNYVQEKPATYKDWSRTWKQYTTGKEDSLKSPYFDSEFLKAEKDGVIANYPVSFKIFSIHADNNLQPNVSFGGSWSSLSKHGEATNLNLVHQSGVDGTDVEDLTRAEISGRKQTLLAISALQYAVPGFEDIKLRNYSMTLGIRDTRKIVGMYNLTDYDVRNEARFPDSIGIFPEFIDGYNILILPTSGRYFQVPYGVCVPKTKVDNLLVAGRCTAGDRTSHAAMRNMMACCVTGQGCGAAASILVKTGTTTRHVDVSKIQEELKRQGSRVF
jgi:hypothetical protein